MGARACTFIPPYLLAHVAEATDRVAECCARTLQVDEGWRSLRDAGLRARAPSAPPGPWPPSAPPAAAVAWTVHDAGGGTGLPGAPARSAGDPGTGDAAIDEAAHGVEGALALFREVYGRASYDDAGARVVVSVHYGQHYVNAFWDGTQLVFGDGDGQVFDRFTKPVDVLGHELTHAVTEHAAGLVYQGQSGALNESVSDVFAACLKQRLLGQSADAADWLVGEGLFLPGVQARGLRDMRDPGTAYDDPRLGRDPQPGHMDDFVETTDDNGGVHINSGIPNRAFVLAATTIGGATWEGAGRIWYAALTGGAVRPRSDFAGFAAATVAAAAEHGSARVEAVRAAWDAVGVRPGVGAPAPSPAPVADTLVRVSRSGGFVGRTSTGEVDLASDDPRVPDVRALVERVDLAAVAPAMPRPDMYVYRFEVCGDGPVAVPEQQLTGDLRSLAGLVLGDSAW